MVGLRPSDLVEIADTARALCQAGSRTTLLYLFARPEVDAHRAAFDMLDQLSREAIPGLSAMRLDMLTVHQGRFDGSGRVTDIMATQPVSATTPAAGPVASGLMAKVVRRLRDPKGTFDAVSTAGPATIDLARRVPPRLWRHAFTAARRMQDAMLVYRRFLSFFSRLLDELAVDAAILPEDIVGPVWPVLVAATHRRGIPSLVCPYTLANQAEAIQSLKAQPGFQTRENAIAAHLHPVWRYRHGDIDIVRLPSEHIFAHAALGITPPDPWMMNSGYADRILVDSRASFEYFRAGGIPERQLAIVGSVSQDRMFQQRQKRDAALQALRASLGLSGAKPLLLISGCPNQLSASVPYCEFATIEQLAAFVGDSVAPLTAHYDIVVRPHPNFMAFGELLAPYGVKSTDAATASLVPLADVFVAFASATIRWAIACGVPTVNYDVFHYGYGDFAGAKGVTSVSGGADFRAAVQLLTPGSAPLQQMGVAAESERDHWSLMDGRSVERIENEIAAARQRRASIIKEQLPHA